MRKSIKILASYTSVIVILLSALPSNAQSESFITAEQVPAGVHNVISGGFWTAGKDEGFFRVVVIAEGVEHVAHRLFIQWIKTDASSPNIATKGYELIRTLNVKELNLGHGHVLKVKTSFGDMNSFKIDVTATSRDSKIKRFSITAKGDGKYVIQSQ